MELAASAAEHDERDYRAVQPGDLRLGAIDGTVTPMPDTPANRAEFGSAAGTGDDAAPYPQLRDLLVSDASTRGTLAVVTGPSGEDAASAVVAQPEDPVAVWAGQAGTVAGADDAGAVTVTVTVGVDEEPHPARRPTAAARTATPATCLIAP